MKGYAGRALDPNHNCRRMAIADKFQARRLWGLGVRSNHSSRPGKVRFFDGHVVSQKSRGSVYAIVVSREITALKFQARTSSLEVDAEKDARVKGCCRDNIIAMGRRDERQHKRRRTAETCLKRPCSENYLMIVTLCP